jgi:hypothetical protein
MPGIAAPALAIIYLSGKEARKAGSRRDAQEFTPIFPPYSLVGRHAARAIESKLRVSQIRDGSTISKRAATAHPVQIPSTGEGEGLRRGAARRARAWIV